MALGESADVDDVLRLDAHTLERRPVSDRGADKGAGIFKTDEAPIKQVTDAGSQQNSVLYVEKFSVR